MRSVQVMWHRGDFINEPVTVLVHPYTRLRIACHCGAGLGVNVPLKGVHRLVCPHCELEYSVNFKGDVYCHECQDKFNDGKVKGKNTSAMSRV